MEVGVVASLLGDILCGQNRMGGCFDGCGAVRGRVSASRCMIRLAGLAASPASCVRAQLRDGDSASRVSEQSDAEKGRRATAGDERCRCTVVAGLSAAAIGGNDAAGAVGALRARGTF